MRWLLFRPIQRLVPDAFLKSFFADRAAIADFVDVRLRARQNRHEFGWQPAIRAKYYFEHGSLHLRPPAIRKCYTKSPPLSLFADFLELARLARRFNTGS
jgi:hypothetical protein